MAGNFAAPGARWRVPSHSGLVFRPQQKGAEMIRVLPIFDLFRHGRAESAFSVAPVVPVNSSDEFRSSEHGRHRVPVHSNWIMAGSEGGRPFLKLCWTTVREEGGRP
jgi:hypothetical protein